MGILGTIYFLLGRFYFQLGEVDTGHSGTALILGALLAGVLIAFFIALAVKGRKTTERRSDREQ